MWMDGKVGAQRHKEKGKSRKKREGEYGKERGYWRGKFKARDEKNRVKKI